VKNTIPAKTVCKFLLRKRFLIPIVTIALLYLIATEAKRQYYNIPVPSYIPQDLHWKQTSKETVRPWAQPCVYTRYQVDQPQSVVKSQIKKNIDRICKWKSFDEEKFSSILDDLKEDSGFGIEFAYQIQEQRFLPGIGFEEGHSVRTELPFVVFTWYTKEER